MLAPSATDVERLVRSIWTRRLYSFYLLFDDSPQSLSSSYSSSTVDARANQSTLHTTTIGKEYKGGGTMTGSEHLSGGTYQSEQALLARRIDNLITRFAGDYRYLWLHLGESLGIRLPPLVWGDGAKRQPEEKEEDDLSDCEVDTEGPPTAKTQKDSRRRPRPYVHRAPQFEEIPPLTSSRSTRVGAGQGGVRASFDANDLVTRALVTRDECLAEAARLFGGGGGEEEDTDAVAVQQIVSEIVLQRQRSTTTTTTSGRSRLVHSSALTGYRRASDERVTSHNYGSNYPWPDADVSFLSHHHDMNNKSAAQVGSPNVSRIYPVEIHVAAAAAAEASGGGGGRGAAYSSSVSPAAAEYDLHELSSSSFAAAFRPLFPEDKRTRSASMNITGSRPTGVAAGGAGVDHHHYQPIILSPTILLRSIYRRKLMAYYTLTDSSKTMRDVDECISFFVNDAHRDKALRRAARRVRAAYHPAASTFEKKSNQRASLLPTSSPRAVRGGTSASKRNSPTCMTTSGNGRLGKAESFSSLDEGVASAASDSSRGSRSPPLLRGRGYNGSTSFHSLVPKGSDELDSDSGEEKGGGNNNNTTEEEKEERSFSREVIALSCMWKSLQAAQGFYVPPVDTSYTALHREKLRLLAKVFSSSPSSLSSGLSPYASNQNNSSFDAAATASRRVRAFTGVSDYGSPLREAFNPNMSLEARDRHDAWQRGQVFPHYPEIESRSLSLIKKRDQVLIAAAAGSTDKKGGAVVKAKSPPKTRVVVNAQSAGTAANHQPYANPPNNRGRERTEGPYDSSRMDALTTEALIAEAFYQKKYAKHFEMRRRKDEEAPKAQISPPTVYAETIRRTTTLFLTLIGITFEQYKSLSAAQRSLFREYLIVDLSRIMLERKGGLPSNPSFTLGASTVSVASSSLGASKDRDKKSSFGIAFAYKGGLSYSSASGLVVSGQVSGIVPVGADVREIVEDSASGGLRVEVTLSALSDELDKRRASKKDNEDDPDGLFPKKSGLRPEEEERERERESAGKNAVVAKRSKKAGGGEGDQLRERYEKKISERYVPQLMGLLTVCGQGGQHEREEGADDTPPSKKRKGEKGKGAGKKDGPILLSLPLTEKLCREGGLISFLQEVPRTLVNENKATHQSSSSPSRRSSPSPSPLSSRAASYASLLSPASASSSSVVVYSTKFGVREATVITKAFVHKEVMQ